MTLSITPRSFWSFPTVPSLWEDDDDWALNTSAPSGLSISEDEQNVYVSAAIPGVGPEDVEITFDKGVVWIKGEAKEEEKGKKYYRKATSSFSYRVAVPGDLDAKSEPQASCKNGVMTVSFKKSPVTQPKRITVKEG